MLIILFCFLGCLNIKQRKHYDKFSVSIDYFLKSKYYRTGKIYNVFTLDTINNFYEILIEENFNVKMDTSISLGKKPKVFFPTDKVEKQGSIFLVYDESKKINSVFLEFLKENVKIDSIPYYVDKGVYPTDSLGVYDHKMGVHRLIFICKANPMRYEISHIDSYNELRHKNICDNRSN